jgi:hypothetical protein
MKITVADVRQFAAANAGKRFTTLARKRPFTIWANKRGIRIRIPSGSYFAIKPDVLERYVASFNGSKPKDRFKTSIYPRPFRETSYMARIFYELTAQHSPRVAAVDDGLNDLDDIPPGTDSPDRARQTSEIVKRNPRVRVYVLKRSGGRCEYCGALGFKMTNGKHYVEAHHIIALAKDGKDTVSNVIALCPDHHRQAHFSVEARQLETRFAVRIRAINAKRRK